MLEHEDNKEVTNRNKGDPKETKLIKRRRKGGESAWK